MMPPMPAVRPAKVKAAVRIHARLMPARRAPRRCRRWRRGSARTGCVQGRTTRRGARQTRSDDPRHAAERERRHAAIGIDDHCHGYAGQQRGEDLETGHHGRCHSEAAPPPPLIGDDGDGSIGGDQERGQDPSAGWTECAIGEVVDRLVGDGNGAAGAEKVDHQPLETDSPRASPRTTAGEPRDQNSLREPNAEATAGAAAIAAHPGQSVPGWTSSVTTVAAMPATKPATGRSRQV
jgi:hypothetical protein